MKALSSAASNTTTAPARRQPIEQGHRRVAFAAEREGTGMMVGHRGYPRRDGERPAGSSQVGGRVSAVERLESALDVAADLLKVWTLRRERGRGSARAMLISSGRGLGWIP